MPALAAQLPPPGGDQCGGRRHLSLVNTWKLTEAATVGPSPTARKSIRSRSRFATVPMPEAAGTGCRRTTVGSGYGTRGPQINTVEKAKHPTWLGPALA